jgi:class III poly(R)-hydroxyalkanoic acid synthase PhaE subunit
MQWDKQTEAALNGWFSVPQKAWENWWDLLAGSTQNGHAAAATPPVFDLWHSLTAQWLATMEQTLNTFAPTLTEGAQTAMAQFLTAQGHSQHLVQMTTEAWQAVLNSASSPDEWQAALATYMTALRQQLTGAEATKFVKNSGELWQLYNAEMQKLAQPWLTFWAQWPQQVNLLTQPHKGQTAGADNPLLTLANLYWDTYNQTLGRMVNLPSLGLMREFNEKVNRGFAFWQENQQIGVEYQLLLGEALLNAFEAYMQRLLTLAQAGEQVESQTKLLELWVAVADEEFLKLFHSERYATVQGQYVNSSMALRRQQRELVEILLRMNDLPTRSDLDEAHHNIFLLRKEVKALKKTVHALAEQAATATNAVQVDQEQAQPTTKDAATTPAAKPKKRATRSRAKATPTSEGA